MLNIRFNFKFFLIFIIVVFLEIMHGGYVINFLFYSQLTMVVLAIIAIVVNYASLDLELINFNSINIVNNKLYLSINIKNKSYLSDNFLVIENGTINTLIEKYNGEAMSVDGFSNKKLRYEIIFKQRGIYDLGNYSIEISDLFSIISIKKVIKKDYTLKVYPKIVNVNKHISNGNNIIYDSEASIGYREGNHSIKDIRKYIPGDSLKKINWKLTAKANEFMVKNYEDTDGNEINVFLDMNIANYKKDKYGELEETLIDVTASLINHSNKNNIDVNLWCNNLEGTYHRFNYENMEDPCEFFIERKSDGKICFEEFMKSQVDNISLSKSITIIAISRDEEIDRIERYALDLKCIPNIICLKGNISEDSPLLYELDELVEGGR